MRQSNGTSIDSEFKKCTKCGKEYPNTLEYFGYAKKNTGQLKNVCKECCSKIGKEKRQVIIELNKAKTLFYEGTRKCKKCWRDLPNNKLYFPVDLSCKDGLRNVCRECSKKGGHFLEE